MFPPAVGCGWRTRQRGIIVSIHTNWIAVEGAEASALIEKLGFQEIGASHHPGDAAYAYARTPQGWLVFVGQSMKLDLPRLLPVVSAQAAALAGEVSDITMNSTLQMWRDGARLWSVSHDPEKAIDNLDVDGEPAADLAGITARLATAQAADEGDDVDHLFDAPLELGERICGYRADAPLPGPWILLAPARPPGPVASALPAAIRAELLPALADLGWTLAPVRLSNGYAYDATRVRGGRLEAMRFLWRDDRRDLEVIPGFACLGGETLDHPVIGAASIGDLPMTLLQRLRSWRPGQRPKSYDQKIGDAITQARAKLAEWGEIIADYAATEATG
jgi:hypothetical protein